MLFQELNLLNVYRLCGGENTDSESGIKDVKNYQKIDTFFPSIDCVVCEMEERFNENDQTI